MSDQAHSSETAGDKVPPERMLDELTLELMYIPEFDV